MAQTVVIIGASRGIGEALAEVYRKRGDHVIATTRKGSDGVDVTDQKSVDALAARLQSVGAIDLLINNAGVFLDGDKGLETIPLTTITDTFNVNALGPVRVTRALLPLLLKSANPVVANITSKMGSIDDNTSGRYYAYRMSKAALNMFNKSLSVDYPKITTVVLHPGWVQTDMGGKSATTTIAESVDGLTSVIAKLTPKQSGKFFDFQGNVLPW